MQSKSVEAPWLHAIARAIGESLHSECLSKRGAVVFSRLGEILGSGYNFKPPSGDRCTADAACKATCRKSAVHAEQVALLETGLDARANDMLHVKTVDGLLVPSGPPSCVECSKLIVTAGIEGMWLYHEDGWRRYDVLEFHRLSLENAK